MFGSVTGISGGNGQNPYRKKTKKKNKMRNGDMPQGMYTPIPQNMTDSDSEEELHVRANIGPFNSQFSTYSTAHAKIVRNSHSNSTPNNLDQDSSFANIHFTNYYNSDNEDKAYSSNPYQPTIEPDNVAILNANMRKRKPMSTLRKCCFVASLALCVLTVVLFLWVVPCNDHQTCPAKSERVHTNSWMRSYERIELKGAINVVHGVRGRSNNLIFMYRGSSLFPTLDQGSSSKRSGIISLLGSSGQVAWYDEMVNEPEIIDCTLIDADLNGDSDCLVVDEFGEIGCINPVSGQWLWRHHGKSTQRPIRVSFPLVLPDINRDGVGDLLVVGRSNSGLYNSIRFISGAAGTAIGNEYIMKKCTYIHKFQLDINNKITFNCINNETEIAIIKSLEEIFSLITNRAINLSSGNDKGNIIQHKFYGQRKETVNQRNIYSVNGKQLIVENNGKCPESCNVSVTLLEEKDGVTKIVKNINGTRMYGMVPARLAFNNSVGDANIHGFVIKFWEWGYKQQDVATANTNINRETPAPHSQADFNKFSNVMRKKRSWNELSLSNDSMNNKDLSMIPSRMRLIKETVILMVFNSTDIRIENTSQSNIIQFCTNNKNGSEPTCQPDLNYQENSLMIADLDQDGSQELVSYYSTYIDTEDNHNKWKLMTYVQLLRLEAELPKLYDIIEDRH